MQLPAMRWIALAVFAAWSTAGQAVGLGAVRVQSGLGQPLRASITLLGTDNAEVGSSCIKAKIESSDGVFIVVPQVALVRNGPASTVLLSSRQSIQEPAIMVAIDIGCVSPIHRDYQILLDPPTFSPAFAADNTALQNELPLNAGQRDAAVAGAGDKRVATQSARNKLQASPAAERKIAVPQKIRSAEPFSKELNPKKAAQDVLRLSGDDAPTFSRLQLTQTLSDVPAEAVAPKSEEWRAAQARFAAMLRDEDPVLSAEKRLKAAQAQTQTLQAEASQLKRQSSSDKAALNEVRAQASPFVWLIGLSGLLLASLGASAWLAWRLREAKNTVSATWWEQNAGLVADDNPKSSVETAIDAAQASSLAPEEASSNMAFEQFESAIQIEKPAENASKKEAGSTEAKLRSGLPLLEDSNSIISMFSASGYDTVTGSAFQRTRVPALKVEEISDVTQEAEFWISLNDPQRAIEILELQSDADHPDSPVPWLYLFDLYREVGAEAKYDALRERFSRLFNARIPQFSESLDAVQANSLEDFPHLMAKVCELWHRSGILPFLESLLVDDREGARLGFDLPVYRDILLLISLAHEFERLSLLDDAAQGQHVGLDALKTVSPLDRNQITTLPDGSIDFEPLDFNLDIRPKPQQN